MTAIACIDKNNGIGKNGNLLISIPDDMKFFREKTMDSIVIMGRKTLFSFKNKEPLKNRINIVFTLNKGLKEDYKKFDNIFFVSSDKELDEVLNNYKEKKAFLIGGESIYNNFIDKCDEALITKVNKSFDADTFFPKLEDKNFKIVSESELFYYNDISYQFLTYKKV